MNMKMMLLLSVALIAGFLFGRCSAQTPQIASVQTVPTATATPTITPKPEAITPPGYDGMEVIYWPYGFDDIKKPHILIENDKCQGPEPVCTMPIEARLHGVTLEAFNIETKSFFRRAVWTRFAVSGSQFPGDLEVVFALPGNKTMTATWKFDKTGLFPVGPLELTTSPMDFKRRLEATYLTPYVAQSHVWVDVWPSDLTKYIDWVDFSRDKGGGTLGKQVESLSSKSVTYQSWSEVFAGDYTIHVRFALPDREHGGQLERIEKTATVNVPLSTGKDGARRYNCPKAASWTQVGTINAYTTLDFFGWTRDENGNPWMNVVADGDRGWIQGTANFVPKELESIPMSSVSCK